HARRELVVGNGGGHPRESHRDPPDGPRKDEPEQQASPPPRGGHGPAEPAQDQALGHHRRQRDAVMPHCWSPLSFGPRQAVVLSCIEVSTRAPQLTMGTNAAADLVPA